MKKVIVGAIVVFFSLSSIYADDVFKAKQENMKAKVTDKVGQSTSKETQEFAKKKLDCIDSSKTEEDLKICKDKFQPQELDALIKK